MRERAAAILAGFEQFLDKVAERDSKISSQMWVATTYLTLASGKGTGAVVAPEKAKSYLDRAASVYDALLKKGGDEVAKYETSIRLKMANVLRSRQKWDEAQEHINWIVSDPKRQNSLEVQVQAAELLQEAGLNLAASDMPKADGLLREATVGRKEAGIWGWGGIAARVSKQVGNGGRFEETFFDSELNLVRCMVARAQLPGKEEAKKNELLRVAQSRIAANRRLYPKLGGESFARQFEKVLKEIQKLNGSASPRGFLELDEQEAGAAAKAAS